MYFTASYDDLLKAPVTYYLLGSQNLIKYTRDLAQTECGEGSGSPGRGSDQHPAINNLYKPVISSSQAARWGIQQISTTDNFLLAPSQKPVCNLEIEQSKSETFLGKFAVLNIFVDVEKIVLFLCIQISPRD